MSAKIDEVGNRYGRLTVIREADRKTGKRALWFCKCDCGNSIVTSGTRLRCGRVKSCGCLSREPICEIGNRYGRLVVMERAGRGNDRRALWSCKCDCGNTTVVAGKSLRIGETRSCGCLKRDVSIKPEIGNRYGRLLVIAESTTGKWGKARWLCRCDCGNDSIVSGVSLRNGTTQSCGCLFKERSREATRLPEGVAAFNKLYGSYKRNARNRGLAFELTKAEFKELTQQPCSYCGVEPRQTKVENEACGVYVYNGIDRVDNDVGYVKNNVVSCCGRCNKMKSAISVNGFLNHIQRIYDYSILGKCSEEPANTY